MLKTQPSYRVFPRFQRTQCWKRGKIQIVIRKKIALYAWFLFYGSRKEKRKTARFKRIPAKLFHLPHLPLHLLLIPLRGTRYLSLTPLLLRLFVRKRKCRRSAAPQSVIANVFSSQKLTREIYVIPRVSLKRIPLSSILQSDRKQHNCFSPWCAKGP